MAEDRPKTPSGALHHSNSEEDTRAVQRAYSTTQAQMIKSANARRLKNESIQKANRRTGLAGKGVGGLMKRTRSVSRVGCRSTCSHTQLRAVKLAIIVLEKGQKRCAVRCFNGTRGID